MKKIAFLFLSSVSLAQSVTKSILLLPDTGQTNSYTTTFGEDNDYSINVPSFTNNGNGTITDNVTKLMWQQIDGGEMTIENAITYCNSLSLGGYSGWRLPTPMEAMSILNLQKNNPAMDITYFPSTGAEYWWTNTFQVGDNTKVWCTNSGGGIGNKPKTETISAGGTKSYHVRAVRNVLNPVVLANHFADNGDGTITDNVTQLVWQKIPNVNQFNWEQAISYAEGLTLANATDWRLPNIKELQSLNIESNTNPSVNTTYFSTIGIHNYWSSTTLLPNPNNLTSAWYWNTQFGITSHDIKTNLNYVICVRGNPVLSSSDFSMVNNIQIYPNPASNYILLNFPKVLNLVQIEMIDINGKIVFTKEEKSIINEYKIDVKEFTDGIYFINLTSDNIKNTYKILIKK